MTLWRPAYVGIGSNLDDPRAQVARAIERLRALPHTRCIVTSRCYGSEPFGPVAQPRFVNAAAGLLTQLGPEALLDELRKVETAMGRQRRERWGPRIIDLDMLVLGSERRSGEPLTLPHPGIVERNFVLYPLAEIAPDLDVPGLGRVIELKGRVAATGIWPL
ncbi:MAG TPA: 2-amino-4-hydroxy-6-hydroxymethyldihydropteridine diphosphokinase [Steroidobacteraceae bacterium]|nr:2-amino-4-hydroxy-6-hydroxymethyldihydropteridine diphosphokinase [Steroidobacteraceae bacterium]